ncbi:MAG: DNA polymerase I [Oscillospiraceae bacterium]|nr:DNA polymerase I [Oscillospiraceae bacterium]MBQ4644118.1 DNA polymerase I [Oscillospiraceae bacterium]
MKILAVDSNSIMNRAFYGIKVLTTKDGFFTNAIYGFLSILLTAVSETKPDAIVFAFDVHAPTFRHEFFREYKAGRHATPQELIDQFPVMKELLGYLGYPVIAIEGWEADDILGTISRICEEQGAECVISTGDRDSLQLIGEHTTVRLATTKMGAPVSTMMDIPAVFEKYGVAPRDLIEVKALMGDTSDNIPGVPGIGEKTALDLIQRYKTVDYIYEHFDELELKPAQRRKLEEGKDSAYLSRRLGEINRFAPISENLEDYMLRNRDEAAAAALLSKLEMYKMIERLGLDPSKIPEKDSLSTEPKKKMEAEIGDVSAFGGIGENEHAEVLFESDGDDLTAVCLVFGGKAVLIENDGFFFDAALANFLCSATEKRTDDLKFLCRWAENHGSEVKNCTMDSSLAGYILNVSGDDYSAGRLGALYHAQSCELSGNPDEIGAHQEIFEKAAVFSDLCEKLRAELRSHGEEKILDEIELPLAKILASMELRGFRIDPEGIRNFGSELMSTIGETEQKIYELCGEEFNILSPKQLGVVLFEHLGLPAKKKTKSGYSTSADVLEDLRTYHPAIDEILEYRKLTKLNSTYVEGLLNALATDGRVHTRFNQKETRTGRISSLEPNLQNIPIRTELGSRMRGFFVAKEGYTLIDADYSQIELRVLAHLSGDQNMISAFTGGTDIHTQTASQVFGVPEDYVTSQMRSRAKAVNFGIVYGIGAWSLGENLGVPTKEAQQYIDSYLSHYSGVDRFMKESIETAKKCGFAVTSYGRRRYLPELSSSNFNLRAFGERVARNMPIQGTAADIIKLAMVRVENRLAAEKLDAKLIMQVHDELIVEASEDCAEKAAEILKYEMENAASLSVPMEVDVGIGKTWLIAH